jgi:hypothetical protein
MSNKQDSDTGSPVPTASSIVLRASLCAFFLLPYFPHPSIQWSLPFPPACFWLFCGDLVSLVSIVLGAVLISWIGLSKLARISPQHGALHNRIKRARTRSFIAGLVFFAVVGGAFLLGVALENERGRPSYSIISNGLGILVALFYCGIGALVVGGVWYVLHRYLAQLESDWKSLSSDLTTCPDCGRERSKQAACPHCGKACATCKVPLRVVIKDKARKRVNAASVSGVILYLLGWLIPLAGWLLCVIGLALALEVRGKETLLTCPKCNSSSKLA